MTRFPQKYNQRPIPPPGFQFVGQPGLLANGLIGFGGTQTLMRINPNNNIVPKNINNDKIKFKFKK